MGLFGRKRHGSRDSPFPARTPDYLAYLDGRDMTRDELIAFRARVIAAGQRGENPFLEMTGEHAFYARRQLASIDQDLAMHFTFAAAEVECFMLFSVEMERAERQGLRPDDV